jgi:hypothetical protein
MILQYRANNPIRIFRIPTGVFNVLAYGSNLGVAGAELYDSDIVVTTRVDRCPHKGSVRRSMWGIMTCKFWDEHMGYLNQYLSDHGCTDFLEVNSCGEVYEYHLHTDDQRYVGYWQRTSIEISAKEHDLYFEIPGNRRTQYYVPTDKTVKAAE